MISYLNELSKYFINKTKGNIVVISSVAGERGRQSNFLYGTSKAALSARS